MFEKVFELQDLVEEANSSDSVKLAIKARDKINSAAMLEEITSLEADDLLMEIKVDMSGGY